MEIKIPVRNVGLGYDEFENAYVISFDTLDVLDKIVQQCFDIKSAIAEAEK